MELSSNRNKKLQIKWIKINPLFLTYIMNIQFMINRMYEKYNLQNNNSELMKFK